MFPFHDSIFHFYFRYWTWNPIWYTRWLKEILRVFTSLPQCTRRSIPKLSRWSNATSCKELQSCVKMSRSYKERSDLTQNIYWCARKKRERRCNFPQLQVLFYVDIQISTHLQELFHGYSNAQWFHALPEKECLASLTGNRPYLPLTASKVVNH